MADTEAGEQSSNDWCECCNQFCTDASREKFSKRFETFAQRRESEWKELVNSSPAMQPGVFPILSLPRELRDKIYHLLLGAKKGTTQYQYVTHDHIFPIQILHLNKQLRAEFLEIFFSRAFVMCQYSINPKHIELLLPPPTLFPLVKHMWARLVTSDIHWIAPSWDQILHDTVRFLEMFPNLAGASLVFKADYKEDKTLDESDVKEVWERSELKNTDTVRVAVFQFEGPRKNHPANGSRVQRRDEYMYVYRQGSSGTGGKWLAMHKSKIKYL